MKEEEGDSKKYASPRKGPATGAGGSTFKIHPTKTQLETNDDKVVQSDIGRHFNSIAQ